MIKSLFVGRFATPTLAVATCAYAASLFWATHAPNVKVPSLGLEALPADKLMHFVGYAGLAFLAILTVKSRSRKAFSLLPVILCLSIVAAIDELTQPLTARDAEWLDWAADVVGIVIGTSLAAALTSRVSYKDDPAIPSP